LEQKQTAIFIATKLYRYFVNEDADKEHVDWLAGRFYKSGFDIQKMMDDIFTSHWFYDEKNIGTKIKSPVEYIVGLRRMLPLELQDENSLFLLQRLLGQVLFNPPNVAGWPGGKNWIDSSTLLLRMKIPEIITMNEPFNYRAKADDDLQMGRMDEAIEMKKRLNQYVKKGAVAATIAWDKVLPVFDNTPREKLESEIAGMLLQTKSRVAANIISPYLNDDTKEDYIKSAFTRIMCTPEYQLC
jgi:hypothetical protein